MLQPVKVPLNGSTVLWDISHSSDLCVVSKLAEVHSIPSTRSLTNKLNRTGLDMDPWRTPLATGLQLDCVTDHNPMSSSIQPVYLTVHSSTPYFLSLPTRMLWESAKSLTDIKVDIIHCSPLIHPASHSIIEGYWVSQVSCPLGEPMTTPDHFLLLHVLVQVSVLSSYVTPSVACSK